MSRRLWSDGGRTCTFQLRRTFRFHTGARVTAQSLADALNRDAKMTSSTHRPPATARPE